MIDGAEGTQEVLTDEEELTAQAEEAFEVPEGVDLSEPIEIPEDARIADISLVKTEADLINLTAQRILDLNDDDPVYDAILVGLMEKGKESWARKGDFEMLKSYIRAFPVDVFKHFDDLRELRIKVKRAQMKKSRRKRSKRK